MQALVKFGFPLHFFFKAMKCFLLMTSLDSGSIVYLEDGGSLTLESPPVSQLQA